MLGQGVSFFKIGMLIFLGLFFLIHESNATNNKKINAGNYQQLLKNANNIRTLSGNDGIEISPMTMILTPKDYIQSIKLTNHSKLPMYYQLTEVRAWNQNKGKDSYQHANDLVLNPPFVTILPMHTQIIRIGYIGRWDFNKEKAYRFTLHQLQKKTNASQSDRNMQNSKLSILIDISLPVFVKPNNVKPFISVGAEYKANTLFLKLNNSGTSHAKLVNLELLDNKGSKIHSQKISIYVLPGSTLHASTRINLKKAKTPKEAVLVFDDKTVLHTAIV